MLSTLSSNTTSLYKALHRKGHDKRPAAWLSKAVAASVMSLSAITFNAQAASTLNIDNKYELQPVSTTVSYTANGLPDFATLVRNEGAAVVNIAVAAGTTPATLNQRPDSSQLPDELRRFFDQQPQRVPQPQAGVGSGFIISADGYILTNAHVVDNASAINVKLQDRREFNAELIGLDELTDVALLKIDANNLPVVDTADSDEVAVGEWVLAIGSPFGFDQTATQGIVSAVSRNLPSATYVPFIQTDVAVNPGNSGGPLFNTDGEVIGVNSQIYSSTGGYQGLSFAIPINLAMSVADQLKEHGQTNRGWLGVGIQDVTPALAESFGMDEVTGALISSVTDNSPAMNAGIQEGDIVLTFNNRQVNRSGELPSLVGTVKAGETVPMQVFRDGKLQRLDVTVGSRDTNAVAMSKDNSTILGMQLSTAEQEQLNAAGVKDGVLVSNVEQDSMAAKAGIRTNDILVKLNGMQIQSVADVHEAVSSMPTGKPIAVLINRDGNALFVTLQLPSTVE